MAEFLLTLLTLFWEFFKTGLFAVGGGLATIPFLYDIAARQDWFTAAQLSDMIAISESTPGPIGINMATYAGYSAAGVLGSVVATFGEVLPSFIIILIIARVLQKYRSSRLVNNAFYGVRPATVGLICAASLNMIGAALVKSEALSYTLEWVKKINWVAVALVAVFAFCAIKFKKHPLIYIAAGAAVGVGLGYANIL